MAMKLITFSIITTSDNNAVLFNLNLKEIFKQQGALHQKPIFIN